MVGAGLNKKSMAYVENVAAFLVSTLHAGPGVSIFNYADKPDLLKDAGAIAMASPVKKEVGTAFLAICCLLFRVFA